MTHSAKLANVKALVRDRGSQFTDPFDEVFRTEGIKMLQTPVCTPVANSIADGGSAPCAVNCSTAPSSGTSAS